MLKHLFSVLALTVSCVAFADMLVTTTTDFGDGIQTCYVHVSAEEGPAEAVFGDVVVTIDPADDHAVVGVCIHDHPVVEPRVVGLAETAEFVCPDSQAVVIVTVELEA